jgi:hypothetical protein
MSTMLYDAMNKSPRGFRFSDAQKHTTCLACYQQGEPKERITTNIVTDLPQLPQSPPPSATLPLWKFWAGPAERVLARATVLLAVATMLLTIMAGIQAYILATTDQSTRMAADAATSSALQPKQP